MKFIFVFISMYLKIPVSPLASLSTAEYSVYICIVAFTASHNGLFHWICFCIPVIQVPKDTHTFCFFRLHLNMTQNYA